MHHRILGAIAFITVFSAIMALLHWYIWRRLVRDPHWPRPYKRVATVTIILLGISIPTGFILWRLIPRGPTAVGATISYVWLGALFYLVIITSSFEAIRIFVSLTAHSNDSKRHKHQRSEPRSKARDMLRDSRRQFITRAAAGSALIVTSGIAAWGIRSALSEIRIHQVAVKLSRLPSALSGYRIAMLTDLHIGPILGRKFIEYVVETTNRINPDLIAITGDLVDGSVKRIGDDIRPLAKLHSRHGVYFVTGNHEYYSGVDDWLGFLPPLGIRVLMNEMVRIGDSALHGASFDLVGVPDYHGGSYHPIGPDVASATVNRNPERELVVLAHQPIQVHQSAKANAGLQLSGHTHGGQIFPFGGLVRLTQPYLVGLHRHAENTQIYVSSGTGFWGPPMRVAAPAEIALIVLTNG